MHQLRKNIGVSEGCYDPESIMKEEVNLNSNLNGFRV